MTQPITNSPPSPPISLGQLRNILATPRVSSRFFRHIMLRQPGVARSFCRWHLPKPVRRKMLVTQLEVLPDRFVDPHVQDVIGDVVLRMPSRPQTGWVYVLILQCCRPHPLLPVYMQRCEKRLYEKHVRTIQDNAPVHVYPSLYYTGRGAYPGPTRLEDVLENLPERHVGQA